ncbi:hypothetical protein [Candidatus Neptunichlamydia sp. REUL1]|uniref:hypothetical protein n=1 Tax=Candidatus Neptunichlamydia sp. REUL1 TaxID=3064277 RepID=UPI00292E3F6F|nr:hypothetical protein [Candidatus Neptunochlamydia sp. REUL1]
MGYNGRIGHIDFTPVLRDSAKTFTGSKIPFKDAAARSTNPIKLGYKKKFPGLFDGTENSFEDFPEEWIENYY